MIYGYTLDWTVKRDRMIIIIGLIVSMGDLIIRRLI